MERLKDKVALVTGAGRNIGRAIALAFAEEGADVVVNDIDFEAASRVVHEIKALGREAVPIKADVSNYGEVEQMVKAALEKFGEINILVNNAGLGGARLGGKVSAEELALDRWNRMIGVTLSGVFFCSQLVGREMIKQKSGKIINISSIYGLTASPFMVDYVAAKHGVVGITKALAVEWGKYKINVNCICPSLTATDKVREKAEIQPGKMKARVKRIPLSRLANPEDISKAAVFLASFESDYITGFALCLDGGNWALFSAYPIP